MKRVGIIAVCLAGGWGLNHCQGAEDVALSGNPYAVVVERNIFGLNPPPPPVDPNAKPEEPPVKIVPNGIMSIFGQLQVLFKVAAKPGGKDAAYMLMEGQSQDEIEVVKINEKAAIVTFNNHGIVQELPLVVTAPTATPAAAAPGVAPGAAPAVNPFNNRFGNRGAQGGVNPGGGINPGGGMNPGGGNDGSNLRPVPTRGGLPVQQNNFSPEEAMIMTVAAKAKAFQDGAASAPIFPPTPLDQDAGIPSNEAQLQQPPTPGLPGQ